MPAMAGPPNKPAPPVDRQFANTLERGLRVLATFSGTQRELGNREIAEATSLPRPTVSRLTHTLVELGYLRRCPDSMRFELSTSVLKLGYPVLSGLLYFRRMATPPMQTLAKGIAGTCAVSVRDRLQMVTIESVTERDVLKRNPGAGLSIHFAVSTMGLAWMVAASSAEREQALREVAHGQPESLDEMREAYQLAVQQQRCDGYVTRHGKNRADTLVAATALRRRPAEELLVLSCAVVAPLAQLDSIERDAGRKLLTAARQIDEAMARS